LIWNQKLFLVSRYLIFGDGLITFLALVFFWKSFLGKGIWQIVVPWIVNITYYFFKRKSLIKKIYAVFEK
jgi:hypothetical protein